MAAYKIKTETIETTSNGAAVEEAIRLLRAHHAQKTAVQRWVCEVCGMIHTGPLPQACDGCGEDGALVQQADSRREMNSRW